MIEACPNTYIIVDDRQSFQKWKFHEEECEVTGSCSTSDCFNLKPDGKLTHCSLAIAVQNIPEYMGILQKSKEALLDLRDLKDIDGREVFLSGLESIRLICARIAQCGTANMSRGVKVR